MPPLLPDQFQTDRLLLRAPREADALPLFEAYTQDGEVARYLMWRPHTVVSQTEEFIAQCIRDWDAGLRRPYVLAFLDRTQEPVGMLEARILQHTIDIGYVLARDQWGAGLMPEAIRAFTEIALSLSDIFRVQATCDAENHASVRVLEKSGFVKEARLDRFAVHPNISSESRPCFMYARCR